MNFPLLVCVTAFALTVLSTWFGDTLRKRAGVPKEDGRNDAGLLIGEILTLLLFIIGFSLSMAIIGIGSCWLIGYRARRRDWLGFLVVPIAVSVCFFLIADLDSPHGGAIQVTPQNLSSLSQSLPAQ